MTEEEKIIEILDRNMKKPGYEENFRKFRRSYIRNKIMFFIFLCVAGTVLFPIAFLFLAKFIWVSYSRYYDRKIIEQTIKERENSENSDDDKTLLTWLKHEDR